MNHLPYEILCHIITFLDPHSLLTFTLVSTTINNLCDNSTWKIVLLRNGTEVSKESDFSWKKYYLDLYKERSRLVPLFSEEGEHGRVIVHKNEEITSLVARILDHATNKYSFLNPTIHTGCHHMWFHILTLTTVRAVHAYIYGYAEDKWSTGEGWFYHKDDKVPVLADIRQIYISEALHFCLQLKLGDKTLDFWFPISAPGRQVIETLSTHITFDATFKIKLDGNNIKVKTEMVRKASSFLRHLNYQRTEIPMIINCTRDEQGSYRATTSKKLVISFLPSGGTSCNDRQS